MTSEERANKIHEASKRAWCRWVTGIMSSRYMIYHWSMPVLLTAEAAVLLFLAIWPLWCGVIVFIVVGLLCDNLNELVSYLAWKRYDRLRANARKGGKA
jgi:hypothetical protein